MASFFFALRFLTRLPLGPARAPTGEEFGRSMAFFPLVGLVIGLILDLVYLPLRSLPFLAGAAVLVAWIAVTGGLHLDGLMDTADGFFANAGRERALEIMKDSRIGSFALMGAFSVLLLKLAFVVSLPPAAVPLVLPLMAIAGRFTALLLPAAYPHANPGAGLGGTAARWAGPAEMVKGSFVCAAAIAAVAAAKSLAGGWAGAAEAAILGFSAWLAAALTGLWLAHASVKRLGGITGDVIGAAVELAETAVLALAVFIFNVKI